MHGAKESLNTNVEEDDTEEEQEGGKEKGNIVVLPVTPSRNIFSRPAPSETPKEPSSAERQVPDTGKKTWSQWLSTILPASVKKPVRAILGAPSDTASPVRTPTHARLDEDVEEEERYTLPGSFDRRPRSLSPTLSQDPTESNNTASFEVNYESPCRKASSFDASYGTQFRMGSFDLGKSKSASASFPRALPAPSKRDAPARSPSKKPPRRSATPAADAGSSFHKPSNFIERMRTAKSNHRYDPYSRPTSRLARGNVLRTESEETLTAEQELEILIQRERDRKVQEAEDRYLKREIKRKLGQLDDDGDEEMSPENEPSTNRNPTVEDAPDHGDERVQEQVGTATPPPKSPVKQKRRDSAAPAPVGPLPNFLFGETPAPAPASLSPPSPAPAGLDITAGGAPPPTSWSFSSDSDKENISSGPPPPPTMSHAQLPAPLATSSQPPAVAGGLFSTAPQPAGGFGLGLPKESPAVGRQRSQAEKFKPVNPSGLRESSTVDEEKENEMDLDIENQKPSSGKKSGEKSTTTGSAQQQQQFQGSQNAFRPSLALKENSGVLNLGKKSEGKVDIRAKIEAVCFFSPPNNFIRCSSTLLTMVCSLSQLSNKQLECAISWPTMTMTTTTFGDRDVRSAVENLFNGNSNNPKQYPPGITSDMFGLAVKVDF